MAKKDMMDMGAENDMAPKPAKMHAGKNMEKAMGAKGMENSTSMEVCVPVSSLASPAEDDQMASPESGDMVQFQIEGKVSKIEGDNAYIFVESVNGKPVTKEKESTADTGEYNTETPEGGEMDEFAQLKSEAANRMM